MTCQDVKIRFPSEDLRSNYRHDPRDWADTSGAAEELNLSPATLQTQRSRGLSPVPYFVINRRVRYFRPDLSVYRQACRVKPAQAMYEHPPKAKASSE